MKSMRWVLLIILVAGVVGGLGYYFGLQTGEEAVQKIQTKETAEMTTTTLAAPPATEEVKKAEASAAAPTEKNNFVIDKKKSFEEVIGEFFGKVNYAALFKSDDLMRRFVTSMEGALSEVQPPEKNSPLNAPDSEFMVMKKGDKIIIDPKNFHRYDAYVDLLRQADAQKMAQIYFHFYSSFKKIYADLGSGKSFNAQVVDVIDNLLETPENRKEMAVFQPMPNGRYLFVEDELENLTPAQKILLRMGPDHARVVKEKLREIRKQIIHR